MKEAKPQTSQQQLHLEVPTIALGCLLSLAVICGGLVLILLLVNMTGGALVTPNGRVVLPPGARFLNVAIELLGYVLVGYITARVARRSKVFNAAIVGSLNLVLGGIYCLSHPGTAALDPLVVVSWVLALPMTLAGAKWAVAGNARAMPPDGAG
jgi:hypothetical protein